MSNTASKRPRNAFHEIYRPPVKPEVIFPLDKNLIISMAEKAGMSVINGGMMFVASDKAMAEFLNEVIGMVTVTQTEDKKVVAVTMTDEEHQIKRTIWNA